MMLKRELSYVLRRLKKISVQAVRQKKWELFIEAGRAYCSIQFQINQQYCDDDYEQILLEAAHVLKETVGLYEKSESNAYYILFYDGFGLDTRGLALIYLKALCQLGYKVIYVTVKKAVGKQPKICDILDSASAEIIYLDTKSQFDYFLQLTSTFKNYKPRHAFFYTHPYDVAGALSFTVLEGIVSRYQINLTDHAFWLGKNTFDYCLEFRNYGASISYRNRRIDKKKLILLPYYPYINHDELFAGFPFEKDGKKVIFSGGSLYKTLGEGNLFYKIVDELLQKTDNTVFLYAGAGDASQLDILKGKYPDRVYYMKERKDLYQLMCHIDIYLNTYPMVGGLMMQYAVEAGKIPYTLKHENDGDGILIRQGSIGIEFEHSDDMIVDILRSLEDPEYLHKKEELVKSSVISEKKFVFNLHELINNNSTQFPVEIYSFDTSKFKSGYLERANTEEILRKSIIIRCNYKLWVRFPDLLIQKVLRKLLHRVGGRICK